MTTTLTITPHPANYSVELLITTDVVNTTPLTVTQKQGSTTVPVRGLDGITGYGAVLDVITYGFSYNEPITFQAFVGNESSQALTTTIEANFAWLRNVLVPSLSVPTIIERHDDGSRETRTTLLRPIRSDLPVAVTDVREAQKGTTTFVTLSIAGRQDFLRLVKSGDPLMLTGPYSWQLGPLYHVMLAVKETRVGLADRPERRWEVEWAEVSPPEELILGTPETWQSAMTTYPLWADMRQTPWLEVMYPQVGA